MEQWFFSVFKIIIYLNKNIFAITLIFLNYLNYFKV